MFKKNYRKLSSALLLVFSYIYLINKNNWAIAIYTIAFGCIILGIYQACKNNKTARLILAYTVFAITPALTLSGQIGALTGFTRSEVGLPWLGVSFVTVGIAYLVFKANLNPSQLFLNILQPIRFSSGPITSGTLKRPALNFAKSQIYFSWLVLGAFFYSVLAAGLTPLLFLRTSANAWDILAFGIVFEIYVYLNFAGISFMVYGLLNIVGIPTILNFNTPFASKDIIQYWQRWHLSFGIVLKEIFFNPLRKRLGISAAVFVVFIASAMWHGVTFNFITWGLFHSVAWVMTYRIARLPFPRFSFLLNIILFPVIVVLGRVIFAESDTTMLITKLSALFSLHWSSDAYALNLSLDRKTLLSVIGAILYVMTEVLFLKNYQRYKYLRKKTSTILLLILILLFGSTGIDSVYGAR